MKFLKSLALSPVVAAALFFAGIALLQFGGPGWSQAVYKWSQTPGVNATIDPAINWAEGQAPSSVNDSARATMAGVAKWRDDLNGTVVTGGTSTAYTAATNQVLGSFTVGHRVCFSPNLTNGATVVINVDGLGNKPLRSSPNTELGAGVLLQGTPYCATYFSSNGGEYILEGFYGSPFNVPLGAIMPYVGGTAPSVNFALPFGQAISCTTYATLFTVMGSALYGGGCSGPSNLTGTFNLPDLRGRAVFGLGNMGGSDIGRISVSGGNFNGAVNGGTGGGQNQTLAGSQIPSVGVSASGSISGNVSVSASGSVTAVGSSTPAGVTSGGGTVGSAAGASSLTVSVSASGSILNDGGNVASVSGSTSGGGGSHPIMPPAMILPYIIRIF